MAITRRSVLLQGSAIGAGLVATNITGLQALAQQAPRRRSISDFSANDPIVEALREGVARLREASGSVTWRTIAEIHGNQEAFNRCPHGSWYFLPWHRAFVVMFENIIRDTTGMRDFAMPYWDWTRDRTLPEVFAQETVGGRRNPLYEESRTFSGQLADENVGRAVIDEILNEPNFEVFGSSRPRGQDSTDQSWTTRRTGNQGPLEANPHNTVHGAVGGIMGTSASAGDPIFWLHHCNVDRLWASWNAKGHQNTTDQLWRDMVFRDHFLTPDGDSYSATVSELENTEALGYVYEGIPGSGGAAVAQQPDRNIEEARDRYVVAMRRIAGGETRRSLDEAASIPVFTSEPQGSAGARRPLAVPVQIDRELIMRSFGPGRPGADAQPDTRGSSRQRDYDGPVSIQDLADQQRERQENAYGRSGQDGRDGADGTTDAPAQAAATPRVVAIIESLECSQSETTQVRVFLDCDYLNRTTSISDDHYAGTFGFFGRLDAHHASHGRARPSVAVDLSETLEKLYGNRIPEKDIQVQLQPVSNYGEDSEIGEVTPARIAIAFV